MEGQFDWKFLWFAITALNAFVSGMITLAIVKLKLWATEKFVSKEDLKEHLDRLEKVTDRLERRLDG